MVRIEVIRLCFQVAFGIHFVFLIDLTRSITLFMIRIGLFDLPLHVFNLRLYCRKLMSWLPWLLLDRKPTFIDSMIFMSHLYYNDLKIITFIDHFINQFL